jgi:hypothetical protein
MLGCKKEEEVSPTQEEDTCWLIDGKTHDGGYNYRISLRRGISIEGFTRKTLMVSKSEYPNYEVWTEYCE